MTGPLDGRATGAKASARAAMTRWLGPWLASLALWGCLGSDGTGVSLAIEAPAPLALFSIVDDVDRDTEGLQIFVRVTTEGVAPGTQIELYRLQAGQPAGSIMAARTEDGAAQFQSFTLLPGVNELQARTQKPRRVSEVLRVTFDDRCGQIAFTEPAQAATTEIRLGPIDDRDRQACGDTFTTRVVASTGLSDGTGVVLLVNGQPSRSTVTIGGIASFDDVVLGQRGNTPNRLAVQVTGSTCKPVELAADVFVDCLGPSCSLLGPQGTELSAADDQDPNSAGLQLGFEVQSAAEDQDVLLVINGDLDNARMAKTLDGTARFTPVALPEGNGVRVKAICSAETGAKSTSERLFNVDTTACSVSVSKPRASQLFLAPQSSPDVAPMASAAVEVAAEVGSDCVSFRALASRTSDCAGLEDVVATPLAAGQTRIGTEVMLVGSGAQLVCVQVADRAGNTALSAVRVTFDNQTPALAILDADAALSVNRDGTNGREPDANRETAACERPMRVSCSEAGAQVQIVTQPEGVILATSLCKDGVADFTSVPLPSRNDDGAYTIIARSTGLNGLVGRSEPRTIRADCQAQTMAFANLRCGSTNIRQSDDTDLAAEGIQFDVELESFPAPRPIATLTIDDLSVAPDLTVSDEGLSRFRAVNLELDTQPVLQACATDVAGNRSCTEACRVIVGETPSVLITEPTAALLTRDLSGSGVAYLNGAPTDSDCDPNTQGLQIAVRATTDAPGGRRARIKLLSGAKADATTLASLETTVVDGDVSGCLDTADGEGLVVRVEVDHANPAVFGVDTREVDIDGNAPSESLTLTADAPDCRSQTLRFREVFDAPAALGVPRKLAGFARRCAFNPIVTEQDWSQALPLSDALTTAGARGGSEPIEYTWRMHLRPDRVQFCAVRGYDAALALTPLGSARELAAQPLRQRVLALSCIENGQRCVPMADGSVDSEPNGTRAFAVGDVNGDGLDDVVIAGGSFANPGAAALYVGSSAGLTLTPLARFVSSETLNDMGQLVAGLGDFNADGYDDFALSGRAMRLVFVVLGRPSAQWPSQPVVVDNGACATDLCIAHDRDAGAGLSAAGDFDGDGVADLALSAASSVVSVLRGSASYRVNATLGGTGSGVCLDARTKTSGPSSALTCHNPSAPTGFHIHTPAAPYALQAQDDRLYISHRGGSDTAAVWAVERRAYTQLTGMQGVGSPTQFGHLTVIHDLGTTASGLFDRALTSIGDFDGDGRLDLAAGIDQTAGRLYVYPGQPDGFVAFTGRNTAKRLGYVISNLGTDSSEDLFGDDIGLGHHPIFGLQGDLDGDGLGDLVTSSRSDGVARGSIDIFYGSLDHSLFRERSGRDASLDDSTFEDANPDAAPYWRRAEYIGDVDGDGHKELAVTEENFSAAGQNGRVIIMGECKILGIASENPGASRTRFLRDPRPF